MRRGVGEECGRIEFLGEREESFVKGRGFEILPLGG